ncbi:hypothetical protein [Granulicella arctica]|uniref:hypothetical protein n=1 Tax=Granulicella arctica TaxID=940613 RepID=UPI0021DF63AD|nr:hypothetical protein [Granulicella arctica]
MPRSLLVVCRSIALFLCCSVLLVSTAVAADVPLTADVAKQMLQTRGVGRMVKVKEANGTVLRAKIVSIGDASVMMQSGSKAPVEVPYDTVTAVQGPGLAKGAKIGIGVGVGLAVAVGIVAIVAEHNLNGLGTLKVPL